tara:strand:+ start:675 stop:1322 length:648 start_codon:yes stop_codon:yes gene_type:complete
LKPSEFSSLLVECFPEISSSKLEKLCELKPLYTYWNNKINVISRKDMDNFYLHHVLHSLSIYKLISFQKGATILDVGTGGGFPGIPLAIMNDETSFLLIDSIGKKIKVVNGISTELNLKNVNSEQIRAEHINTKFDFVISRAVSKFSTFCPWVKNKLKENNRHKLDNGILYLKGGDLTDEIKEIKNDYQSKCYHLYKYFKFDFFLTKQIVHLAEK